MADQQTRTPDPIGTPCEMLNGDPARVTMVLSLMPASLEPEHLQALLALAEREAADDPTAAERRARGRAVGLKLSFEVDPEDVRDFIAGRRSDLKTWYLSEPIASAGETASDDD